MTTNSDARRLTDVDRLIATQAIEIDEIFSKLAALETERALLRGALEELFDAYCSVMRDGYDFPGRPWTPERDNDEVAMRVLAILKVASNE